MTEFALIERYFRRPARGNLVLGVGDDAALLRPSAGSELVLSCDTLVAGRHFLADADPADVAWKALNVNLSDLAAMGADASCFLLALTLPEPTEAWLTAFARGLFEAADHHAVQLAGGDTTRGPLSITITAIGEVPAGEGLRRSGAREGDALCVTGTLGDAAAALAGAASPDLARRLHRPTARLAAGCALRGVARAAIDISDGLMADVGHLCAASGVGVEVRAERLPLSAALSALPADASRLRWQASGGDDYELACSIPPEALANACAACAAAGVTLTAIGTFVAGEGVRLLAMDGEEIYCETEGYSHF